MNDDPPRRDRFATTRWSLVLAAGGGVGGRSKQALASLCEMYWPPVYAFVRHQGHSVDDARDLTQEFFARVIEKNFIHGADRNRGRFRSYLFAAVSHFLSNERDRARALKRGGPNPPRSLNLEGAEGEYQIEPRDELTPEKLFDYRWALVLLGRVLSHLEGECVRDGKNELFDELKGFLTGDSEGVSYKEVAATLGMTEGAVKVAVHRLRRRFRDLLIDEIAETVSSPEEIEEEIQYLTKAVSL